MDILDRAAGSEGSVWVWGTIPKQRASGTRRQLGSPDSYGYRSRVIILLSRTFNCGALAPQHQEPEVDPQFPDYVESSTPSQAMLYHCRLYPSRLNGPPLAALCLPPAEPPQTIASYHGCKLLQSIKSIEAITLCATHGHGAVHSFVTSRQPQHLASFSPTTDHSLHVRARS